MGIPVIGDLRADARAHFRAQLDAMGYDVDGELADAKIEAANRAAKEGDADLQAALAGVDETHWLCMYYLNAVKRRILPRPRFVEWAPSLASNPLARQYMCVVKEIEAASLRGDDLTPRLSKMVGELRHDDAMLNDWGIHHLHLGSVGSAPGALAGRTGPLLFVFVQEDRIYFLDVLLHGKGQRPWIRRDLVEVIHSTWPDAIRRFRMNAVAVTHLSDDQVATARRKNLSMFVETKDSTVYAPLGGGYMTSGISAQAVTGADWFCTTVDEFQDWAEHNGEAILEALRLQRGISLTEVRVALIFGAKAFAMFEVQSRTCLRTSAP